MHAASFWCLGITTLSLLAGSARPVAAQTITVPDFVVSQPAFADHIQGIDVAVGTDGRVAFLWGEYTTGAGNSSGMAVTRQCNGSGVLLGPAARVDTSKHVAAPLLDSDTRGGYVAAWWWIQSGRDYAFFGQFLDGDGHAPGGDFQVDFQFGGASRPAGVAGLPSGSVFMWNQSGLWGQRFDVAGQKVGEPFEINPSGGGTAYDLVATPSGGFVASWTQTWTTPFSWVRAYGADGQPLAAAFPIGPADFFVQSIAASPLGGFAAAGLRQNDSLNNTEIWMVRFTEDGQTLGSHRVEIPSTNVFAEADVAIDAQGKILVVWSEYQSPGEGFRPPRARAFDPDGNGVTFGFWPTLDDAVEIHTALLPDGQFVNSWYSNNRVKAHVVSIPPPSGVVCGDGVITPGFEECDDGAANSDTEPDACRLNCLMPSCGDTVTDGNEGCDDGNETSCDGCSATCEPEPGEGCGDGIVHSACGEQCDDGNVSSLDGCDYSCTIEPCMECSGSPSVCGARPPAEDCVQPVASGKSKLMVKEHPVTAEADKLVWTFTKGAATTMDDLGDPLGATGYSLCVYDREGGAANLVLAARIPAGGSCDGKPCWKMVGSAPGTGFKYGNKQMDPDGIRSLLLTTGPDGRSKVVVKGRGSRLNPPATPLAQDPSVVVQLANDAGTCWSDTYGAPAATNEQFQFKDKGD